MTFRRSLLAFTAVSLLALGSLPAEASSARQIPANTRSTLVSASETRSFTLADGQSLDRLLLGLGISPAERKAALAALSEAGVTPHGGAKITVRIQSNAKTGGSLALLQVSTPHQPEAILVARTDEDLSGGAQRSVRGTVGPDFPGFLASLRVPHAVIDSIVAALPQGQPSAGQRFRMTYRVSGETAALVGLNLSGHGIEARVAAFPVPREAAIVATVGDGQTAPPTPAPNNPREPVVAGVPTGAPVPGGRLTSPWGWRIHPVLNRPQFHKGVDYSAPAGTPVHATADGTVAFAGRRGNYGRLIRLQHSGDIATGYAHLQGFAKGIKVGTKVPKGDIIGYVGHSGLATGNHLYYEVFAGGKQIDPLHGTAEPSNHMTEAENKRLRQALARNGISLD